MIPNTAEKLITERLEKNVGTAKSKSRHWDAVEGSIISLKLCKRLISSYRKYLCEVVLFTVPLPVTSCHVHVIKGCTYFSHLVSKCLLGKNDHILKYVVVVICYLFVYCSRWRSHNCYLGPQEWNHRIELFFLSHGSESRKQIGEVTAVEFSIVERFHLHY